MKRWGKYVSWQTDLENTSCLFKNRLCSKCQVKTALSHSWVSCWTVPPTGKDVNNSVNPCVRLQIASWIFGVEYICFLSWKRCKKWRTLNCWPAASRGGDSSRARECATTLSLPLRSRICAAIDYRHDSWSSHGGAHAMDNTHRYTQSEAGISYSLWRYYKSTCRS